MNVFHKYDIRGTNLTKEFSIMLAGKLSTKFKGPIIVGKDSRSSSPMLHDALIETLRKKGIDVIDIGNCTTPMINFASIHLKKTAVMITASHNPPEYNGFKILKPDGIPLWGEELQNLAYLAEENDSKSKGKLSKKSIMDAYLKKLLKYTNRRGKLRIVIDTGNGDVITPVKKLFSRTSHLVYYINSKIDPKFPDHLPDPTNEKNYNSLKAEIVSRNADLGIMFDGDGDRAWFVDKKLKIISPHLIFALMCDMEPKGLKVYDLRFSKIIDKITKSYGKRVPVGNPLIKNILRKRKGVLGGEVSGHYMFKDMNFIDDGLFAAVKIINYMLELDKPISSIVKKYEKYVTLKEININVRNKGEVLDKIQKTYKSKILNKIDGLTVGSRNWWFNVRKSNTEDLIRISIEAKDKKTANKIRKELIRLCK